jgi:hypothetical protein
MSVKVQVCQVNIVKQSRHLLPQPQVCLWEHMAGCQQIFVSLSCEIYCTTEASILLVFLNKQVDSNINFFLKKDFVSSPPPLTSHSLFTCAIQFWLGLLGTPSFLFLCAFAPLPPKPNKWKSDHTVNLYALCPYALNLHVKNLLLRQDK